MQQHYQQKQARSRRGVTWPSDASFIHMVLRQYLLKAGLKKFKDDGAEVMVNDALCSCVGDTRQA
eukprot:11154494-Ditylum_brightwellii.AAC.1